MNTRAALKAFILVLVASTLGVTGLPSRAYSQLPANLFTTTGNVAINLGNATGWKLCVEPASSNTFQVSDIVLDTVFLISNGTGSVSQIPCVTNKPVVAADRNSNGIQDIEITFTQANLQALFSNFHGHKAHTVVLGLTGNLVQGGTFSGTITIQVNP